MQQVHARLELVLTTDSAELREKATALKKLQEAINDSSKAQVVDKIAYTWFNRLMALRFMDANDYQPIGVSVVTPKAGYTLPELLDEAKQGTIPDDLKVNTQHIYDLLDGKIPSTNAQNEAYKVLLIAACNHLHTTFPFLFERINDYAELLLPDDLTSEFSVVQDMREGMTDEDCQEVELIGWLYQFYISERKDEVFAAKGKVEKADIPAATQLFTPRWIVEYMVQNTLGKLWLQNRPNSNLRQHMPYFIESPSSSPSTQSYNEALSPSGGAELLLGAKNGEQEEVSLFSKSSNNATSPFEGAKLLLGAKKGEQGDDDYLKVTSVEDITLLDQACGSGHILVYAFELFSKIYEEEGYSQSEIPQLILAKNLHGFEIDERAAQLASLALMMKARSYHRRVFRKALKPNILRYQDLKLSEEQIDQTFQQLKIDLSEELKHDLLTMQQATNFGSLILPRTSLSELAKVLKSIHQQLDTTDLFFKNQLEEVRKAVGQLVRLGRKYHCIVDNPPYMGGGNMNKPLAAFVKKNYPDSKADLMACFMEAGLKMLYAKGFLGMINQHSWMFLSSYGELRKKLIKSYLIDLLVQIGYNSFPELNSKVVQATTFVISKQLSSNKKGGYINLNDASQSDDKKLVFEHKIQNGLIFHANQKDFEKIPGSPIGYWLSESQIKCFEHNVTLGNELIPRKGMVTGDNLRFIRLWSEVQYKTSVYDTITRQYAIDSKMKWFPYAKGGGLRRWYGLREYVVNWFNDGSLLRNTLHSSGKRPISSNYNLEYIFNESISWSSLTSSSFTTRYYENGFLWDAGGSFATISKNQLDYLGFLNSTVGFNFLKILNPTLNFQAGNIANLPIALKSIDTKNQIVGCVKKLIDISKLEWNSREISWNFEKNDLLNHKQQNLKTTYYTYCQYWQTQFHQLHQNEEELNRQFIKIYGLEDELTPDVPLEEITILKQETSIQNGELVFHADEVMRQFISYAVGCMFGRYSLDKEGLVLANQGETLEDYIKKVSSPQPPPEGEDGMGKMPERGNGVGETSKEGNGSPTISFMPDDDNIIPILDEDWFTDDIVGRFYEFLKVTFGADQFEQNLAFVQECIGKDMRKYFVKDFYKDHIKRYKKRPIYWLFASPKGSFSVLIYLHRYTPDTLNQILNGYLKEYRQKLNSRTQYLDHLIETGSSSEQTQAAKEKEKIKRILLEIQEYEREILYPLATERIALDLDDGVLVNYNKFGKAIKEVPGLNDKKAKAKVRKFDWIEVGEIRD